MRYKLGSFLLIITDMALINLAILIAYLLRFDGNINAEILGSIQYTVIAANIIKIICFGYFKLYSSLWQYASIYEATSIIEAVFISNSILFCWTLFFHTDIPKSIFVITLFIDIVLIGGVRFAYRAVRRIMRVIKINAQNPKRVLIIGGGGAGAIVIKELIRHPDLKSIPVAIIDDDKSKTGKKINGIPIVGNRSSIAQVVERQGIDEIIITIPSASKKVIGEIYDECSKTRCKVKILPGFAQLIDESMIIQRIRDVDVGDLLGREAVNLDIGVMASYLKDQTVLVTGGGGSIGSELCRNIASFNPGQLIILDNYENNAYELQNELLRGYPKLTLVTVIANIRDAARLDSVFREYHPDVVFHAAAHKHVPLMELNPTEAIKNNIFGTLNVVECSKRYNVKRFILISTDKAVNPVSVMGATKRVAELIVKAANEQGRAIFASVRFGNVLGSNGSVIPLFKKQIQQGGPVTVTHPEVTRFFMTISEAAQLVIEAGAIAKGGEIFVLDMGKPVRIYDLAKTLIKLSGFEPEADIKIEFTGLRPGEKMNEELLFTEEELQATGSDKIFMVSPTCIRTEKLKKDLEYLNEIVMTNPDESAKCLNTIVSSYKNEQQK